MMNSRCIALVLMTLLASAPLSHADTMTDPIAAMVARVKPAVVQIVTVRPPPDPPSPEVADNTKTTAAADGPTNGIGSGFVIDPKGFVATNKHVVENAISVFVATPDGIRHRARVVGVTHHADIALLKIDSAGNMPSVPFGDSDKLAVGEKVVAIGSPFGFEGSVTTGIVSAVNRDIMESPFDDYIQTDAAINHGNSGGPLFNLAGEVVGMNSVLFAPGTFSGSVGLGFAIPSNDLNVVLTWMKTTGHVVAGMLPIRTQPVTWMLAQAIGTDNLKGALVTGMDEAGSRMMDWRIKPGDIIQTFNGLVVWDPRDLARKAAVTPIGSEAELGIQRGDQHLREHVKIQPYPEEDAPVTSMKRARNLGLDLASVPNQGVTITDVDLRGTAAESGIQKGDVILQVQAASVTDPSQALRLIELQTVAKRPYAAVLILRDGKSTWVPVAVPE